MKKMLCLAVIICVLMTTTAVTETTDLYAQIPDELLTILYDEIVNEMQKRGLLELELERNAAFRTRSETIVLHEGKYVIGDDIPAGTYLVTCTEVDDSYQSYISAMSGLAGLLGEEEGASYASLFGALGTLAGEPTVYIKIVGSYGSTEKSYKLKKDENIKITLRENTAIEISEGSCTLESQ